MNAYRLIPLLFCLLGIAPAQAEIDAMALRLLEGYSQELRWDNIESAPEWIGGVEPTYHDDWQMHRVVLNARGQTTVFLPAYESLRLYHPTRTFDGKELDVYVSNGSGLALKQTLQRAADGHSLVLSPHSSTPLLVHIERPGSEADDFEAALFISRKTTLNDIAPYPNLLAASADWCLLAQEPFALPEYYNRLLPHRQHSLEVSGPARLAIKNRLAYEQNAEQLIQEYRIRYRLDEQEAQELDFSTSVETGRIVTVNTEIAVVGREQQAYVEIPEGQHRLVLEADRPLYVQVLAQTEKDYLFPGLNNPRLPVETVRKQGLLQHTELMQQAQNAKRIAQDNSRKAGGMAAANLLKQAALKREDYPEGLSEAEQLRGTRSFYRDVLPSKKASQNPQFMAYFLSEPLHRLHRTQQPAILADRHLAEAVQRIGNGYFTRLSRTANEYRLPEQPSPGQLRLIADKRNCVSRRFHIKIDQYPAMTLWLRCEQELAADAFSPSLAAAALARLRQETDDPNVTLEAPFSVYAQPASLINTAVLELPLPKGARNVKLWLQDWDDKNREALNIAVQYRAAKPFLLSEHSYLATLKDAEYTQNSAARQRLENEWRPLQRLLQSEYRLYRASVAKTSSSPPVKPQEQKNEIALAESAERHQLWLEALEHWGNAANASSGLNRQQAQLAQAKILSRLGEDYLAGNLRRYLSLYAESSVAEQAAAELAERYLQQSDHAALLTLAAAMYLHRPGTEHTLWLLDALLKNGEYRFALLLGLSFEHAPVESLLSAAYQLQWWQSYQALQDRLPPDKRRFWQGLTAQRAGDYQTALKAWSTSELKPWHDYLQQGLTLRDRLTQLSEQNAPSLYQQWAQWQQRQPGADIEQNALHLVTDYDGDGGYYSIERDLYAQAVKTGPQRPVVLNVLGPATLNFRIRPLHSSSLPVTPLNGWLSIKDNNEIYRYPYTNNLPSQGLKLTGSDDFLAGSLFNLIYQVGQGRHEIKLNSEEAPLSISVKELRPEFPLSVLTPLQTDTLAEMARVGRLPSRIK